MKEINISTAATRLRKSPLTKSDTGLSDQFLSEVIRQNDFVQNRDVYFPQGLATLSLSAVLSAEPRLVTCSERCSDEVEINRAVVEETGLDTKILKCIVADWVPVEGDFDAIVAIPAYFSSGKINRRYFLDALVLEAHKILRPHGEILFVQGSTADIERTQVELDRNGFDFNFVAQKAVSFPEAYLKDTAFMDEIRHIPNAFEMRNGFHFETLYAIRAVLARS
ncbi:MAG: methyltransferase [Bdellovibrionales bacterium]|nr:methyltransferase [Bdellovibrionales bacterium]